MGRTPTKTAQVLLREYDRDYVISQEKTISVNPVVAELATWYEKLRTAMDYREEEVILRAAIERILKRRLFLGGTSQTVAEPLIRELIWARYFPDASVPEAITIQVANAIGLYLKLQELIHQKHHFSHSVSQEWLLHLLSSEIEQILKSSHQKDLMSNFIFQLFQDRVIITDDSEQTRDVQVFIAVRRAYAKDDLAFLRHQLFKQFFGKLDEHNVEKIAEHFPEGYREIEAQLKYSLKDRIYGYINRQVVPFLILDDVLKKYHGSIAGLVANEDELNRAILEACNNRYRGISSKVKRAILRSVIFILMTKAVFALAVEGTFESLFYGRVVWTSMAINILTPPALMVIVGSLIQTPTRENSFKIMNKINSVLFEDNPPLDQPLVVRKKPSKKDPILSLLFVILWLVTFVLSFGAIVFILSKLHINLLSQAVFIFFLAIVSFISYRISQTAHQYIIRDNKESFKSVLFDFFFAPPIYVGRKLTQGISQINIILFFFDFIIETPFKGIFAFFEQWFLFLRTQREKLD